MPKNTTQRSRPGLEPEPLAPESSAQTISPRRRSALVVVTNLTRILFYILQSTKGQSLRIQRNQDDDSDGPVYSDVDDAPTPPPHRRALGPSASLPAYRTDHDFYGTKESGVTVLPKMRVY